MEPPGNIHIGPLIESTCYICNKNHPPVHLSKDHHPGKQEGILRGNVGTTMTVKKANTSRKPLVCVVRMRNVSQISVVVKARFLHRLYTPISLQHEKGCRAQPRQLRQKKKKTLNTVIAQGTGSFFYHVQRNSVKNKRGRNHTKCKQTCNKLLADKEKQHAHNRKKTPRTIRLLAYFCNAKMQRGSVCLGTTEGQPASSSFFRLPPSTTKL